MDARFARATLPQVFDLQCYRSLSKDLDIFEDAAAHAHYVMYGAAEGRRANHLATRNDFVALIPSDAEALEIGPFNRPMLSGPRSCFFDVLSTSDLILRASALKIHDDKIPAIDFVSPSGDLSIVDRDFDYVLSSHCLEHQPDLLSHLKQVERILRPGGQYFILVPDKRYCFDHFIGETCIAEVIDAHSASRTTHTIRSVIEHRALTTHNDCGRHWAGDHGLRSNQRARRITGALREFEAAAGAYIDVHAWYFTPESTQRLMGDLRDVRMITFVSGAALSHSFQLERVLDGADKARASGSRLRPVGTDPGARIGRPHFIFQAAWRGVRP